MFDCRIGSNELKKFVVLDRDPSHPTVYVPPAHGICWLTVNTLLNSLSMIWSSPPARKLNAGFVALLRSTSTERLGSHTERASATTMS